MVNTKGEIMARKGENIRKRKDGRWEARYIKGRKPDGSIQYGYVYAQKYSDAKQKRNEAMLRAKQEKKIISKPSAHPDLNQLFDEWKMEVRHTVKDSSYFFYETMLECHIRPYFGEVLVEKLTGRIVQSFIDKKVSENLSATYIHSIMVLFQSIMKFANHKEYWNIPIFTLQYPKIKKTPLEIFTLQEWNLLQTYLKKQSDDFSFGIFLCMFTGLRIGELSGLKWKDFDSENGQILIRRTVYRMKNEKYDAKQNTAKTIVCITIPKTHSSIRNIPLPPFLLKELFKYQKEDNTFLLTGTSHCMEPRSIQKKYKKLLKCCGLRYLNFHSLRHSFATIGIQKGFDYKTLSEILGHASVNTTLNTYVHSSMERKRECIGLLEEGIKGRK